MALNAGHPTVQRHRTTGKQEDHLTTNYRIRWRYLPGQQWVKGGPEPVDRLPDIAEFVKGKAAELNAPRTAIWYVTALVHRPGTATDDPIGFWAATPGRDDSYEIKELLPPDEFS
ncbi:hypothetical protein D5S17_34150 [Pseudonocardiaceae bacterium YIM PH 21723]|nr:hypothetical protein D5S17_34150 [Pseudonocardiaceae bacterium YIM PH 21723]